MLHAKTPYHEPTRGGGIDLRAFRELRTSDAGQPTELIQSNIRWTNIFIDGVVTSTFITFSKEAHFDFATFNNTVDFRSATFNEGASFRSATFSNGAYFLSAKFKNISNFNFTIFNDLSYLLNHSTRE